VARIRTVKPEFFRHELLQDLEITNQGKYPMLVFAGLWGHCDKSGSFEWRPRILKLDILPFMSFDMAETLTILAQAGLVEKYTVDGKEYGHIPSFEDHQRIGGKEAQEPSKYPAPIGERAGKERGSTREATGKQLGLQEGKGRERKGDSASALPDWLPLEAWKGWLEVRTKVKAPNTHRALALALGELAALRAAGQDPAAVLDRATVKGWKSLYAVTPDKPAHVGEII